MIVLIADPERKLWNLLDKIVEESRKKRRTINYKKTKYLVSSEIRIEDTEA